MIILVLILILELYLLSRVLKFFLLSPIYLYVTFSLLSIIITVLYFYFFEEKFSMYGLDKVLETPFLGAIKMYIIALSAFLLGTIIYYDLSTREVKKLYNKSFAYSLFIKYEIRGTIILVTRVLFFVIVFLYVITYGKEIFIRSDYLPETNRALIIIIKILSFIEVILLGIIYAENKLISRIYFLLLILISIGTGSRAVFLFFLVYFCIVFISQGNTLLNKLKFSFNVLLSLVFLSYLMQFRRLETHGIIPYLQSVATSGDSFLEDFYFNIYYSLIFGVFVTIRTLEEAQFDWNIIFVSLNPLPGTLAGWYNYADDMRLNIFAPYSLHGRIFTMGTTFTVVYFFITGLIFSFMEHKIRVFLNEGKRALAFIITLLLILHIVYGFEYNLRAAFRYIYYTFFVILLVYLYKYIRPYLLKKKPNLE